MVGDGHPMGVSAQVVEDLLGAPERRFAVDDPIPTEEWAQESGESFGRGERLQLAVKAQLSFGESAFQRGDELAPKNPSQNRKGKKEAATGGEPALVVRRESAGGDHTMDMRMMLQLLVPSVKDTGANVFSDTERAVVVQYRRERGQAYGSDRRLES